MSPHRPLNCFTVFSRAGCGAGRGQGGQALGLWPLQAPGGVPWGKRGAAALGRSTSLGEQAAVRAPGRREPGRAGRAGPPPQTPAEPHSCATGRTPPQGTGARHVTRGPRNHTSDGVHPQTETRGPGGGLPSSRAAGMWRTPLTVPRRQPGALRLHAGPRQTRCLSRCPRMTGGAEMGALWGAEVTPRPPHPLTFHSLYLLPCGRRRAPEAHPE